MDKILTVAVCAYNMEDYLGEALESCMIPSVDKIEVLIMNDGSTDHTEDIANTFCDRNPETFRLVTKSNGGWGSNVNLATQLATGKYFRILDADDWFDKENLEKFVQHLLKTDAEVISSLYIHCYGTKRNIHHMAWEKYAGQEIELEKMQEPVHLSMWGVTYRSDLLKEHPLDLPEHILYTDSIYVLKPLTYAKYMSVFAAPVYNYRLGRDGQSVSCESVKKHYKEMQKVMEIQLQFYKDIGVRSKNRIHLLHRMETTYHVTMENFLKMSRYREVSVETLTRDTDLMVKNMVPQLYERLGKRKYVRLLRKANYKDTKLVNTILRVRDFVRKQ